MEGQSIATAQEMLAGGLRSKTRELRLRRDGSAQSTGMVCGGDVTVYFRRIPVEEQAWDTLAAEVLRRVSVREKGWLVQPLDGEMPYLTDDEADKENCFTMPLPVGERAVIFGAGHIARALVPLLCTVGFRPVVFDDRPQFATRERFPQADLVICGDFTRIRDYLTVSPEDYVVIMTNGHEYDFQAQVQVLRGETAYVGVIGSRKKTAFVNQRLPGGGHRRGGHRLCPHAGGHRHQGRDAGGDRRVHHRGDDPCTSHPEGGPRGGAPWLPHALSTCF